MLAADGDVSENIACTNCWKGFHLAIGLIHLAEAIVFAGILLSSSMNRSVSLSSRAVQIGMNGTTRLYSLSLMLSLPPVALMNLCRRSGCLAHSTASLLESSSSIPPFLSWNKDLIFKSGPFSLFRLMQFEIGRSFRRVSRFDA